MSRRYTPRPLHEEVLAAVGCCRSRSPSSLLPCPREAIERQCGISGHGGHLMPSGDREYRLRMGRTAPSRTTESGLVANGAGDRKRRGPAGADGLRMTPAAVAMSDGLQLSAEVV